MLEVRPENGVFLIVDTATGQAVMRFDDRRQADKLVAELQVQELHAALERFAPDHVPPVY